VWLTLCVAVWAKWPWLDPVGAILLSLYIIYEWMIVLLGKFHVAKHVAKHIKLIFYFAENIRRLTGQAASVDDIKQLTYMAYRFSAKIVSIETVRAYYNGDRCIVEVDIVMPPECPLREALQDALELLDNVERAFVHLDFTSEHQIEHRRVVDNVGFGQ
jgi:divalent metal cation (Fe/Co/Zn/Cd) transporter